MHLLLPKSFQCFYAIGGRDDPIPFAPEHYGEKVPLVGVVFDYEDAQ
jgi:hypothetical protein